MSAITTRPLAVSDGLALAEFFHHLGPTTRRRYSPHPLDREIAQALCANLPIPNCERWVVAVGDEIIGYLLLDRAIPAHDRQRYAGYGHSLDLQRDRLFAPVVADAWQGRGVMSAAMPVICAELLAADPCQLVLMGGVQADNDAARAFYRKWGFVEVGQFHWQGIDNVDMVRGAG